MGKPVPEPLGETGGRTVQCLTGPKKARIACSQFNQPCRGKPASRRGHIGRPDKRRRPGAKFPSFRRDGLVLFGDGNPVAGRSVQMQKDRQVPCLGQVIDQMKICRLGQPVQAQLAVQRQACRCKGSGRHSDAWTDPRLGKTLQDWPDGPIRQMPGGRIPVKPEIKPRKPPLPQARRHQRSRRKPRKPGSGSENAKIVRQVKPVLQRAGKRQGTGTIRTDFAAIQIRAQDAGGTAPAALQKFDYPRKRPCQNFGFGHPGRKARAACRDVVQEGRNRVFPRGASRSACGGHDFGRFNPQPLGQGLSQGCGGPQHLLDVKRMPAMRAGLGRQGGPVEGMASRAVPKRAQILQTRGVRPGLPGRQDAFGLVDKPVDHHLRPRRIFPNGLIQRTRRGSALEMAAGAGAVIGPVAQVLEGDDIRREAVRRDAGGLAAALSERRRDRPALRGQRTACRPAARAWPP